MRPPAEPDRKASPWNDAVLAAEILAVDPAGLKGIAVRARAGPVRDAWLGRLVALLPAETAVRRMAPNMHEARLLGGLDLARTLTSGRPVLEKGLLVEAHDGLVILPMAERVDRKTAGLIAAAMDEETIRIERDGLSALQPARFALVALDEGIDEEECLPAVLQDRLALHVDLDLISHRDISLAGRGREDIEPVRERARHVEIPDILFAGLISVAAAIVPHSLRPAHHLIRVARIHAALCHRDTAGNADALAAIRLCLAINPAVPDQDTDADEPQPEPPELEEPESNEDAPNDDQEGHDQEDSALNEDRSGKENEPPRETIADPVEAILPRALLEELASRQQKRSKSAGAAGRAGQERDKARRGRVIGAALRPPSPDARPDVLATLRSAAPWQRLRRKQAPSHRKTGRQTDLEIRADDFRYARRRERGETTALFVVDASGSAAAERLAETKGAVELMLAECYVRRDRVAVIAFRGHGADLILPPTRSLVRAKRALAALPGGGGTPLAAGLAMAYKLVSGLERSGEDTITVILSDARANLALDGSVQRAQAMDDALDIARRFKADALSTLVIDPSARGGEQAGRLATALGADFLKLPRPHAQRLSAEVLARMPRKDGRSSRMVERGSVSR